MTLTLQKRRLFAVKSKKFPFFLNVCHFKRLKLNMKTKRHFSFSINKINRHRCYLFINTIYYRNTFKRIFTFGMFAQESKEYYSTFM